MSKIGQSDCPTCKKWIAECTCNQAAQCWFSNVPYEEDGIIVNEGDKIDAIMRELTEEQQQAMEKEMPF